MWRSAERRIHCSTANARILEKLHVHLLYIGCNINNVRKRKSGFFCLVYYQLSVLYIKMELKVLS